VEQGDLLPPREREALLNEAARREDAVAISALTGWGVDELREKMAELLRRDAQLHEISLPAGDGSRIAWLHARGEVIEQETRDSHVHLQVRLSPDNWARFQSL
jgi:GTP-binding protein HflX